MDKRIAQYYKALSNPVRSQVFLHVARESEGFVPTFPKKESCVTAIAKALNVPQPTVSNHLRVLEKAGLIKSVQKDTHCYQYINKRSVKILLEHTQYLFKQAHKNPY